MKSQLEALPQVDPKLGDMVRGTVWGDMTSAVMTFPAGTDLCPLLEGLPGDKCQCPHWGYVIEGRIRVSYADGTTEVIEAGDLYYWPPGHTVLFEADTRYVEFSPKAEMDPVLAHVVSKMG